MKKILFLLWFFLACNCFSQMPKHYADSIFMQKGDTKDLFFYSKQNVNKGGVSQRHDLISALYSNNLKMSLSNQLGVFFSNNSYEISHVNKDSLASNIGLKTGDTILSFGGITLSNTYEGTLREDILSSGENPSFMFTVRRQGNTIELGGGIKNLHLKEMGENFLKRFEKTE